MKKIHVGILIFDQVEVLDFTGPFEAFSVTRNDDGDAPFSVSLHAEKNQITTVGGMVVSAHHLLDSDTPIDVLVVPGGIGTRTEMNNSKIIEWVQRRSSQAALTTSVCTGSLVLGKAGLLENKRATTHNASLEYMEKLFPKVEVVHDKRFIFDGGIVTSAGISAGIDMALKVIEQLVGEDVARRTARHMEYPYPESDHNFITSPLTKG